MKIFCCCVPLSIKMGLQTLFIFLVLPFVYGQDRKISSYLNPGCQGCGSEDTLVYIQAEGANDTIHQIWDFTRGIPTVIYTIASVNSSLNISWDGGDARSFVLSEKPKYSFAVAIDKLIEYDDLDDYGRIEPNYPQHAYSFRDMAWRRNVSMLTDKEAMLLVSGKFRNRDRAGTIDIKLDLLPFKDYGTNLPHLIHTGNSSLMDVSLAGLGSSRDYNASRYALCLTLASTDPRADTMHLVLRKSLDDEHTPGVFEIIEVKTPETFKSEDGGFIQFRPVGYTETERTVSSSTVAHVSDFNRTSLPKASTLRVFYRGFDPSDLLVQDMLVSFGETGDGYYRQHNYTAWSFTIGYGTPPVESFSLFVVVIICVGLGVPVALALSGAGYVLVRRCRQRAAGGARRLRGEPH